jgi:glucose/arabinose dehydrogenase
VIFYSICLLGRRFKAGVFGRAVGLVIDKKGNLLVADDVGNRVWRITSK